jgi:hypothetical protein
MEALAVAGQRPPDGGKSLLQEFVAVLGHLILLEYLKYSLYLVEFRSIGRQMIERQSSEKPDGGLGLIRFCGHTS